MSRGSDIMPKARVRKSSVEVSESGELKFEEAEELDVGDAKEVIIYLPPSQDDFDSEVARSEMYRDYFPETAKGPLNGIVRGLGAPLRTCLERCL